MADSFVPFQNPGTVDGKLDTESLTVGANTVLRERVQIAGKTPTSIVTPKEYTNSVCLPMVLVDTNGDPYVASGASSAPAVAEVPVGAGPMPWQTFWKRPQRLQRQADDDEELVMAASILFRDEPPAPSWTIEQPRRRYGRRRK